MKLKTLGYICLDVLVVLISIALAIALRFDFNIGAESYVYLAMFSPLLVLATVGVGLIIGVYNSILSFFGFAEMARQFLLVGCIAVMAFLIKIFNILNLSGSIIVLYCIIFFVLSCAVRGYPRFLKWIKSIDESRHGNLKRTLIIGAGKAGAMIVKQFQNNSEDGYIPVGVLDDNINKKGKRISGVKILGTIDNTAYFANTLKIDEILIAMPSASEVEMAEIFDKVANANKPTRIFQSAIDVHKYQNGEKSALKEITIEDLLFREPIKTDNSVTRALVENKVVLVTGGAGSIGSELCRQVLQNNCEFLVIFDIHENGLFDINEELKGQYKDKYVTCMGSIRDRARLKWAFDKYNPSIVIHAAAHKHVPMMEINPFEAIKNNVFGTLNLIRETTEHKCKKFIQISTDKAVNPTNVMGATKRVCELLVKSFSNNETEMVAVRFGNVLGSNGSVIPLFKKQIASGGPVTLTHKDMTRYFMTIKEAVSLVLSAGAFAKGSEFFVLDMGQPVKIYDLAINLIRLSGRKPFEDVDVKITGLRPGEKLYEELQLGNETIDNTSHKKIFIMRDRGINKDKVFANIEKLSELVSKQDDVEELKSTLFNMIKDEEIM